MNLIMTISEFILILFMKLNKKNNLPNFVAYKKILYYIILYNIFIILLATSAYDTFAQSEVYLSIRAGGSDLIGVGFGGFHVSQNTTKISSSIDSNLIHSVENTLITDLNESAFFRVKTLSDTLTALSGDLFALWRASGARCYIHGEVNNNNSLIIINVIDLKTAFTILNEEYRIDSNRPWYTSHIIVDDMIELFTGLRGSFASQIAFIQPYYEKSNEIFIINSDGRDKHQLSYSKTLNISPSWSPDGNKLVFSSLIDNVWSLMMININTGQNQNISNWSGLNSSPAWSPLNPDLIAFSSTRDGNSEIYSCRTDGKNIGRLTNHYKIDSSPSWSPDCKQIAFTSDRIGQPNIYIMNSDGSNTHRLTSNINAYEDSPCWSPRGDRIAFVILHDSSFDIATTSPSGEDTVILTFGEGSNENPRWSPDGLKIVFSSTRLGGKNLFIMNWDGSNVRPLTKDNNSFSPAWSPVTTGNDIRISSRR